MIFLLVILAATAQAADLLTFYVVVNRYGPGLESNPIVADLYRAGGIWTVAGLKGLAVLGMVIAVYAIDGAGGPRWLSYTFLGFGFVLGAVGAATNVWALSLR